MAFFAPPLPLLQMRERNHENNKPQKQKKQRGEIDVEISTTRSTNFYLTLGWIETNSGVANKSPPPKSWLGFNLVVILC